MFLLAPVNNAITRSVYNRGREIECTIPIETNQLKYTAATVILEMTGCKMNKMNTSYKGQYPPCRRRLEVRLEVSQISELQKVVRKKLPN